MSVSLIVQKLIVFVHVALLQRDEKIRLFLYNELGIVSLSNNIGEFSNAPVKIFVF